MEVLGEEEGKAEKTKGYAHDAMENWTVFENCLRFNPIYAKHTIFATHITRKQVAKTSRQKPLYKIFKILSKSFSRLGHPLTNESRTSLSKLATELPPAK